MRSTLSLKNAQNDADKAAHSLSLLGGRATSAAAAWLFATVVLSRLQQPQFRS